MSARQGTSLGQAGRRRYLAAGTMALAGLPAMACAVGGLGDGQSPAPAAREVTITVDNDWTSADRLKVVQAWLDRASRVHPNIKHDLRILNGNAGALAHLAADTQGDIMHFGNQLVLTLGPKNVMQDISSTLSTLRFDEKTIFDLYDATHYERKRVGFPIQINSNVWVYNKTWFRDVGATEPNDRWTWQDHLDAARRLTNAEAGRWGMNANGDLYPWYWQAGVDFLTPDRSRTLFNSGPAREVLNWVVDIITKHRASPNPAEIAEQRPSFAQGSYATAIASSPGSAFNTQIDGRFEWEIMATPKHPRSGKPPALVVTGVANVVMRKATERGHLRETVQLLLELYSPEVQELYLTLPTGSVPPRKATFYSPASLKSPPANLKLIGDQIATGQDYPTMIGFYDMHSAIVPEFQKAARGEQSANDAAANMERLGNAALANAAR
jgi:ABC-type glycerol-3-phosphate transport system substrate-binding protein